MRNVIFVFILFLLFSCEYENAELNFERIVINYQSDVSPLISRRCSLSGCHINGAMTGDFSKYSELKMRIDNGKFQIMVFETKMMPPAANADLSEVELMLLRRWIEQGAEE
jgi:hypothetical protein